MADLSGQPAGLTDARLDAMAELIRSFRDAGGTVLKPPHDEGLRQIWLADAEDFYTWYQSMRANWPNDPMFQDLQLETGLDYLRKALRKQDCIVAVHEGDVVAAISFQIRAGKHVQTGVLGSQQDVRGAGTSVELALAEIAVDNHLGVVGVYIPAARGFHLSIGRRLDVGFVKLRSEWTAKDCVTLVEGMKIRL